MMWLIQLLLELWLEWLAQPAHVNLLFAALALWAAIGRGMVWCALCAAMVHVALMFV